MAEVVGKLLIDKLIPLLKDETPPLLINEINRAKDVRNQLRSVADQLLLIQAFLKDADKKAQTRGENRDAVKEWIRQMKEVSFSTEDAIDEYLFVMNNNKILEKDMCGIIGVVASCICEFFRGILPRRKILEQLGEIKESLKTLEASKNTYNINPESNNGGGSNISNSTLHYLRGGGRFIVDDKLVGVDHTKELLTKWLLEKESPRTVITIVGQGGLGKTTIVNKVFKELKKRNSFDCHAFVTMSHSLQGNDLLNTLIKCFNDEAGNENAVKRINTTDSKPPEEKLQEYLQRRNYMIVFDDVWEESFWGHVEFALPKDTGRIIIITRDKKVADFCISNGSLHRHVMEGLNQKDSWELFCLNAFRKDCPKSLEKLAEKFVKKCNGVPLAIVAMARLLLSKGEDVTEWQRVNNNLGSQLLSDPHLSSVHQVLSESYDDLNYRLKSCLLHFGLFHEDYLINCNRLINLWTTQGLIENKDGQTQEEVAEDYLMELVARSLVKAVETYPNGRVKSCQVHDLMHEFVLGKCKELNFFLKEKSDEFMSHEMIRHLSINTSIDGVTVKENTTHYGLVRSCFLFNIPNVEADYLFELLCSSFKLLVRLDCEGVPLHYLPETVGNWFHLKYLNLRNTNITTIPKFITKLQNLETLDIKYTDVYELPPDINKLIKLRHLLLGRSKFGALHQPLIEEGIGNLTALQTLGWVNVRWVDNDITRELKNLKQLKTLHIRCPGKRQQLELLCSAIESMEHLCKLTIVACDLDLVSLLNPPRNLKHLHIKGYLEKLPDWIPKLENLVRLRLTESGLKKDPLPLLKTLSTLLELQLEGYHGKELYFQNGWFMNLKVLKLSSNSLETLVIDEGAMPHLQQFDFWSYPETLVVPPHIQQLIPPYDNGELAILIQEKTF